MLKDAAYPEAAVPLAALINDPRDDVQFEAIAAELNIFLAEKIVARKRVGLVIEVRNAILAEPAFASGPLALGSLTVPPEVLTALRSATRDDNPGVGLESLYTFGVLAVQPGGAARRDLLRESGPELASLIGAPDPAFRYAALRVLGRVFARRAQDDPIEVTVGDAVIAGLNDNESRVKRAAMDALAQMRYERAVQPLTDLFQYYGKGDGASAALDAVARIAHPSGAQLLSAQLSSKSTPLRTIAIEGLARLGDSARLTDIQAALGGAPGENVLLAGAFAASMLSGTPIDPIAEALTKPRFGDQAKSYLVELAPGRTSAFTRYLQDPDARIRASIADVFGLAGDPAALPSVEPLMSDRDPQVARAAQRAVARLRQVAGKPGM
jgi:HEAT repeat protein